MVVFDPQISYFAQKNIPTKNFREASPPSTTPLTSTLACIKPMESFSLFTR